MSPWFYIVGTGTVYPTVIHGTGTLYQCGRRIQGSDYDRLRKIIIENCDKIDRVIVRGRFKLVAVKLQNSHESNHQYGKFVIHLSCLDNMVHFIRIMNEAEEYSKYYEFKYFTRIYRASDHLRITVPKSILPSGVDFTGWPADVLLEVENNILSFKARIRAGKRSGKVLYYYIRIPRRKLRKQGFSEGQLVNREAKVWLTIPINPGQVGKHQ